MKYFSGLKLKLIYVMRINQLESHKGCLKIGETTCDDGDIGNLPPNCTLLNRAARDRINGYTRTAGIAYELLHTELALYYKGGINGFNDKQVHSVLERSGIKKKVFDIEGKADEWYITDLETVRKAIAAVKEERESLLPAEISHDRTPIDFRPEQREAIEKTKKQFKKGNQMLWNAKMRFGKTLSALQVVKDMNFRRTLILTHRPVVDSGWFEDFSKIFYDRSDFAYGSKNNGGSHASLEAGAMRGGCNYVYFASMQDLRGSELVGGNFDKNDKVFATPWSCIIVDEAHEGTQTELGKAVMQELVKDDTKVLRLSGTPFNLLDDFKEDEIYTWDYVMEQRAKASWDSLHFGDSNPYASLPTMNIYTYDLGRLLKEFVDEDVAFNFREFFRVTDDGSFVHESDVRAFLNLLTKEAPESCYPFANKAYRDIFRHTLWMLPGVKEARALSAMLREHNVFQYFKVVNVAGDGDSEEESGDALQMVNEAIGRNPDETRTITLSCGRLTTGVSVPAWTGVFMLSGSYNTAASSYMQTIFRVQTPATINGRMKTDCYVFDFAPDRTLKVIAETAKISSKAGKTTGNDRKIMGEFLNFCPIISVEGSKMNQFDVPRMLEQLKRVYVERVVRNGFEDKSLYSDELMKLNDLELKEFDDLKKIIGNTKAMPKTNGVDINNQGLTDEQYEELESLEKKSKKRGKDKLPLTEEERLRLEELKKKRANREAAISILRGISIRMPLLIYGAELKDEDEEITIDNFALLIDPQSWEEFMPKGVTVEKFNSIKKYYDPEIFCAAGKRIRAMARAADKLGVEERIERITDIFRTFRNPDKETVLTPWRVVNMHLGDCLGGYNFFDSAYETQLSEPRFIDRGDVTADVFAPDSRILEINSKSGLYPLYMAYSIYRTRVKNSLTPVSSVEEEQSIWDKVVAENIFVICKTPMAKSITKRTLIGFRKAKVNTRHFEDLINQIKNKPEHFIEQVNKFAAKNTGITNMKFNAIVGNPPYQEEGVSTRKSPIYHLFYDVAFRISSKVTLITPGRFLFKAGETPKDWMEKMLADPHLKVVDYFQKSTDIFPSVDIKGGVVITYRDTNKIIGPIEFYSEFVELKSILNKVMAHGSFNVGVFAEIVSSQGIYRFSDCVFTDYPRVLEVQGKGTLSKITSNAFENLPELFLDDKPNDGREYLLIIGRSNGQRLVKWIRNDYLLSVDSLNSYRVFIPEANGTGVIGEALSTPIVAKPMVAHTDTFLSIGRFSNESTANACLKYIKSKFARTLLGTLKATQHNPKSTWLNVPLQDFTPSSDIDWSTSVADIDKQLYAKYKLTDEEISFIELMIKPM